MIELVYSNEPNIIPKPSLFEDWTNSSLYELSIAITKFLRESNHNYDTLIITPNFLNAMNVCDLKQDFLSDHTPYGDKIKIVNTTSYLILNEISKRFSFYVHMFPDLTGKAFYKIT